MPITFTVSFKGTTYPFECDEKETTLAGVQEQLASRTGVPVMAQKLAGKGLVRHPDPNRTLQEVGIRSGSKLMLIGSTSDQILQVQHANPERVRGFEDSSPARRATRTPARTVEHTPFTFVRFEVLPRYTTPPASEALKLLHRFAEDPGIKAIMQAHRWRVGVLKEMHPEGRLGIDAVCLLGLNVNKGAEIHLRLRTDDLTGFRGYEVIRKTLLHELAHMEHTEHNANFHQLNRQLNAEACARDWTRSPGHRLSNEPTAPSRDLDDETDDNTSSIPTGGVYVLGGQLDLQTSFSPQRMAGAAALLRITREEQNLCSVCGTMPTGQKPPFVRLLEIETQFDVLRGQIDAWMEAGGGDTRRKAVFVHNLERMELEVDGIEASSSESMRLARRRTGDNVRSLLRRVEQWNSQRGR